MHDVYVAMDAMDRHLFAQFDLTQSQFRILSLLSEVTSSQLTDLSEQLLCARSTVTRLIDSLEQHGWVKRDGDSDDRRAQQVSLTHLGRSLWEEANALHLRTLEERLTHLPADEQVALKCLLEKLRHSLSEQLVG
jgi:DNA-binding MarR family transcriptional regulator